MSRGQQKMFALQCASDNDDSYAPLTSLDLARRLMTGAWQPPQSLASRQNRDRLAGADPVEEATPMCRYQRAI